jgi:beta-galactosidase GanA
MRILRTLSIVFAIIPGLYTTTIAQQKSAPLPYLKKQGTTSQLIVNNEPFLILGGELGNSSASDLLYMKGIWSKLKAMHCNTVLMPVYWELIEPVQGQFDFVLLDSLLNDARQHNMKVVLLWFGTWKNSMSCYAPSWVKTDFKNYPRAYDRNGNAQEILTPFSENNLKADINAFRSLMSHLKKTDEQSRTVIMVQVENEIGMLPEARDYHPDATKAFKSEVPARLMQYLQKNRKTLAQPVAGQWQKNGFKTKGTWEEVFGYGLATDEIFMSWHFAEFTNRVAHEGKRIYELPMFVNAALNRPNAKPGEYPSGGPLPHIIDIWKAAAPSIDFLSPDFYNPDFKRWNDLYTRQDNPLFIPEIRFEPSVAAKAFYAVGHYHAMGFSPFSIESTDRPHAETIGKAYDVLSQLNSFIGAHQGKNTMNASLLDKNSIADTIHFGDYIFVIKHDYTLGWSPKSKEEQWPQTAALIIQTGKDDFIVAGTGAVITFFPATSELGRVGILTIEEGRFVDEKWKRGRVMNGDQSHQGRHLRFEVDEFGIQKLSLYRYE